MVLIDAELAEEKRDAVLKEAQKLVEQAGAKIAHSESWGNRKLAFEIDHRKDANYHLFQFEADRSTISDLNSKLRIVDGILRFRTISQSDSAAAETAAPVTGA